MGKLAARPAFLDERANVTMANETWFEVAVRLFREVAARRETSEVRVASDLGSARVWFEQGRLVDAELGSYRGIDAVLRVLSAKRATFELTPGEPRQRTIEIPIEAVLAAHARNVAEDHEFVRGPSEDAQARRTMQDRVLTLVGTPITAGASTGVDERKPAGAAQARARPATEIPDTVRDTDATVPPTFGAGPRPLATSIRPVVIVSGADKVAPTPPMRDARLRSTTLPLGGIAASRRVLVSTVAASDPSLFDPDAWEGSGAERRNAPTEAAPSEVVGPRAAAAEPAATGNTLPFGQGPVEPSPKPGEEPNASPNARGASDADVEQPTVVGAYDLIRLLRRSAKSALYLARASDGSDGRLLMLRLGQASTDPPRGSVVARGLRVLQRLEHPNLATLVDAGLDAGRPYSVTEYVDGVSLDRLLEPSSYLPLRLWVPVLLDVLMGLHAGHTATDGSGNPLGLVHGRLLPEDVVVGVDGVTRVLNLGLRRLFDSPKADLGDEPAEELAYLAPEQARGERGDRRSDIFSMGVLLHNALAGENLFGATDAAETLDRVLDQPIPPPSTRRLGPPSYFDSLCMKALERDPNQRFQWSEEMLGQLRRIGMQHDVLARKREVGAWIQASFGHEIEERRALLAPSAAKHGVVARKPHPEGSANARPSDWNLDAALEMAPARTRSRGRRAIQVVLLIAVPLGVLVGLIVAANARLKLRELPRIPAATSPDSVP